MAERITEFAMGTAVTIEISDRTVPRHAVAEAFRWVEWVDRTFSTYVDDSEIARLNEGAMGWADVHPLVREVLVRGEALRVETGGYFDMRAGAEGRLDPSGLVKGWAVDAAFDILLHAGVRRACIEAGGDVRVAGGGWRVGVRHPFEPDRCAAVLLLDDGAVATSGAYERGGHVLDPLTGQPPSGTLSVTLVDLRLARADAYATAAFAMGSAGPAWSAEMCAMTILENADVLLTPSFDALRLI